MISLLTCRSTGPFLSGLSRGGRFLGAQAASHLADGLPEPMLIFDQGQAQVAFPGVAETPARTDSDLGLLEQLHGKVDRAQALTPFLRVPGPDEHAGLGPFHFPADALQAVYQDIAA